MLSFVPLQQERYSGQHVGHKMGPFLLFKGHFEKKTSLFLPSFEEAFLEVKTWELGVLWQIFLAPET